MTTIAVNQTGMACDLQMTHASGMKFKCQSKILDVPTHSAETLFNSKKVLVGFCGSADVWPRCIDYLNNPQDYKKPPKISNIELVLLNDKKQIYHATNFKNWLLIDSSEFALGSGSHFALGALDSGKTLKEAVRVAMKYDPNTGMGVKEYLL